ncbi:DUF7619 domain-containing protein [Chryseobacterium paludis]|uniref:DUF7619 domain-containing protein n=1 Tax=Chryseobacterium paludis TaxID=2956784 RepID=UPI0021C08F26|nr:T9SS type A sorting domain-containing protein [Chryseobacterium paludis]
MKKIYIIISLILFSVFNAQIVNIPDANFKAKLLSSTNSNEIAVNASGNGFKIDANDDGEIQVSEALVVAKLKIENNLGSIVDVTGINAFINLKVLTISDNNLTSLSLNLPFLNYLSVGSTQLSVINIAACTSLETVWLSSNNTSLSLNNSNVTFLSLDGLNLQTINLQGCPALKNVQLSGIVLQNINGSNMSNLEEVTITDAPLLSQINFSASPMIEKFTINNTGLPNLNLANFTSLELLSGTNNSFQNVILDGCISLLSINLPNNHIASLSMGNVNNIASITLSKNNLTSLSLNNLNNLGHLDCKENNISNLTLNNLPNLQNLYLTSNHLTSLNLSSTPKISSLLCSYNQLANLDLSLLTKLQTIECSNNLLPELNFTNNKLLSYLQCTNNPNLTKIFLKNGSSQPISSTYLFPNPSLTYICCDDEEMALFNYAYSNNGSTVINSYCSFTPGGPFYTIEGNTKYDSNNNGCDVNDNNKALQHFKVIGGGLTGNAFANSSGNYSIPVQAGFQTIIPVLENPTYFNISPSSFTANFPTQASPLIQNLCVTANGTHNDLEVVIIPIIAAAPGFDTKYRIVYKNKGTTTQSGTLIYNYNDDLMNYLNSTISPNSQSTGILSWNFANLLPFETREIIVTFKLNTPTQTPALNGGDILHYTAQVNAATDDTPADNTFTLNQTVVNSFDPNDKTCLEGSSITQAKVGDYVHYLIRFENTGTANAHNIVVKDEIDATKFDISSLIPLHGSHNFVTRITNPNVVEFIFENIQLPFDDANNDGYVSFKIKTKSNLVIGDSFSNTAKIYFDYNAPIITNTSTTSVQNTLGTSEINNDKIQFSIYPNPVKDVLFIKSKENIIKAEIYDIAGRILSSVSVTDNSVNTSELTKGNYIIKLFTKDKSIMQKFIKN